MNLRNYVFVTGAYWGFTLTDGALRMLVLLHFFHLGYSPVQLAFLFLFYEFFGIVTNLLGGWLGSQMGLRVTLIGGLMLQVVSLGLLALLNPAWPELLSVAYVMVMQRKMTRLMQVITLSTPALTNAQVLSMQI